MRAFQVNPTDRTLREGPQNLRRLRCAHESTRNGGRLQQKSLGLLASRSHAQQRRIRPPPPRARAAWGVRQDLASTRPPHCTLRAPPGAVGTSRPDRAALEPRHGTQQAGQQDAVPLRPAPWPRPPRRANSQHRSCSQTLSRRGSSPLHQKRGMPARAKVTHGPGGPAAPYRRRLWTGTEPGMQTSSLWR